MRKDVYFQLVCCSDYTELESMRLSLEAPGLLLAGDRHTLQAARQAAKLLNIKTTQVRDRDRQFYLTLTSVRQVSTTEEALASYRQSAQTLVIIDTKHQQNFHPHNIAK